MEYLIVFIVIIGFICALAIRSGGFLYDADKEMRRITREYFDKHPDKEAK